ncbi:MAG: peroxiredoxin [Gemmatimonadaceae bacterium]|nr:peroxiredoxin [Gemmatimonadaceae bacterium]
MRIALPELGSIAPDFTATASDGSRVSLRELLAHGSVALFFYPGDDTPGCNRQLSAVRDDLTTFRAAGIQPFGVNPAGVESHARYASKFEFNFPLLVDAGSAIAAAYGAVKEDGTKIQRSVIGIGRDGTIRFATRGAPPPGEVIAALEV